MDWKDFDWKSAVKTVAPGLATLLGGPLAGGAVTVLAEALLGGSTGSKEGDELAIQQKLAAGMTPEDKAKIVLAESEVRKELIRAGIREKELANEDRAGARSKETAIATSEKAPWVVKTRSTFLAYLITGGFFGVLGAMVYFAAAGVSLDSTVRDPLLIMLGSLGTAWASVVGYDFGSSAGSAKKDDSISALSKR
jgi:hypothetical protein